MNTWEHCSNNHASEAQHLVDCAARVSNIPQEAVEAAAKAIAPHRWDPEWLPIIFHGETLETARSRARESAMTTARRALEVAAPYLQATNDPHFGCPDCGDREGCDCRWKGVL